MTLTRRILLAAALLATLVASYLSASTPTEPVQRVEPVLRPPVAPRQGDSRATAALDVAEPLARSRSGAGGRASLFAIPGWMLEQPATLPPGPTAPAAVEPSPAPEAPPLPFRVLGRYIEGDTTVAFVQYNDVNLALRTGDSVAEIYRVEDIKGNTLYLRYLPLGQMQTLDLGPAN